MNGPLFNPKRLTFARRRVGLTKSMLARKVGVELRTVTAYEGGEYAPAADTFAKLQSILNFPGEFFFGDDLEEPAPDAVSFRAMSKMTAAQRDMALTAGALAFQLNDWLEEQFELPRADLPDLSREPTPEVAADSLRRQWGLGELPIRNMVHLLEAKGIRVFSLAINAREVDAFSTWRDQTPFVFLNLHKSPEHTRYDTAHELGHLVLHRHASPHGREAERQADVFGAAFLMPKGSVLANARCFPTLGTLIRWKKIWVTSVAALNYRLHEVGLVSDWQYRNLCIEIAKHGYRTQEPEEAAPESSQMLPKLLNVLREGGVSRSRLARYLNISDSHLEELMFGLVMTTIDGGHRGSPELTTAAHSNLKLVK